MLSPLCGGHEGQAERGEDIDGASPEQMASLRARSAPAGPGARRRDRARICATPGRAGAPVAPRRRHLLEAGRRLFGTRGIFPLGKIRLERDGVSVRHSHTAEGTKPGGVYLGVGPDQNFTYIVALKPRISFIFDIRRGNLQEHLLYKAVIELSRDRADFLSLLFSRPRPPGLDTTASADVLLNAYAGAAPSDTLYQKNLKAVKAWLITHHGFALGDSDVAGIEYVYSAFSAAGPDLTYNFGNGQGGGGRFGRGMPTYADLMVPTDGQGDHRSYIASGANYRALRDMELNNVVVPLVGNFAGEKAIRAVAAWLKERRAR
jgi:hypothetical protein